MSARLLFLIAFLTKNRAIQFVTKVSQCLSFAGQESNYDTLPRPFLKESLPS